MRHAARGAGGGGWGVPVGGRGPAVPSPGSVCNQAAVQIRAAPACTAARLASAATTHGCSRTLDLRIRARAHSCADARAHCNPRKNLLHYYSYIAKLKNVLCSFLWSLGIF